MSDSPSKPAAGPGSADAAESPSASPTTEASAPAKMEPIAAMDAAAKAMDAAVAKTDSGAPAPTSPTPATSTSSATAAPSQAPPAAALNLPSLPATTSGMHLQYVAPGVKSQSFWASNGRLLYATVIVGTLFVVVYMFKGGGGVGGDIGDLNGAGTDTTTSGNPQRPTADPRATLNNGMAGHVDPPTPQADFTVNAGAIGDTTAPLPKHDAGKNKGGYAQEQIDLDAARAMIEKDPDKALALVDQHDVDYPRGILDPEARVIRVEAFAKKGDDAKALALGNEFLEDYPHSPGAGRVQSIIEAIKNKQGGPTPTPNH